MRRAHYFTLLLLLAPAARADDGREHLRLLLKAHHGLPGVEVLRQQPGAREDLLALAADRAEPTPLRDRALLAVARLSDRPGSDPQLLAALRAALGELDRGTASRHQLLYLLSPFGAPAVLDLRPYLADADPAVRLSAAVALERNRSADARAALAERAAHEADPRVRAVLDRSGR